MKYSNALVAVNALLAATVVHGQSAPDFPIQVDNLLVVDYQNTSISVDPGVFLTREDTLETPVAVGPSGATRQSTYILFMVDQDVQLSAGADRVQLLHYFQPNLFGASEVLSFDAAAQNATSAVGASYIAPNPPAGDIAHRYTFLLYLQPEGFEVPTEFSSINPPAETSARIGFDIAAFVAATNLGDPIGATWFQVQNNGTGTGSSTTASGGSSTATATATETESAAAETSSGATASATGTTTTTRTSGASATSASATASVSGSSGNGAGSLSVSGGVVGVMGAVVIGGFAAWLL